jgi:phage-related protein
MTDAEKSQSIFNAVMESGTKDLELAGELSLSFGEKMQQISKETADASVSLGESLLPVIETLADIIIPLIKNISKFAEENPTLVRNIIIATGAIAGIIAVVGTLGLLLPSLIAGFGAFGAILSFIMSPIGLVVGAIAGLIAVGVLLWKNWEEISDKATMIWNNILNLIKGILKKIGDFIYDYISFWVGLIDMFLNIFGISVKDIQNAIESMMTYIKNIFSTVSEEVSKIWNGLWGGIKDMVNSAVNFMKPIIDGFVSWFQDKFDVIGDIVSSVKGAIDSIGSTIGGAVSSVSNIGKSILGGYQFGIDSVPRTGMYMLHKGESVSPAGSSNSIVVNINGGYYMSERAAEDIGDKIIERLKREVKL